jgi:glycosyltransferase involved in cell wall biosynthesis
LIRILHVLGKLDRGGAETWLVQVLRHVDRQKYQMDFLVHSNCPGAYDDEVRALGSAIMPCLGSSNPFRYAMNFHQTLKERGPYDVVHSHVHHYSGYVLMLAAMAGVPIRIAHSHSDTRSVEGDTGPGRSIYLRGMKAMIQTFATHGLAVSCEAGDDLFCKDWQNTSRWELQHLGIDLSRFELEVDRSSMRRTLGIRPDAFVVGHVGRFSIPKNHTFLIDIAKEVVKLSPKAVFVLIGDGPLRAEMEAKVASHSLTEHFIFAGLRSDVPQLMKGVMDAFLFPSLYEGLPIALLEAQAAGLKCMISDVISPETDVVADLITRESLKTSPARWAAQVLSRSPRITSVDFERFQRCLRPRSINSSIEHLVPVYSPRQS